LWQRTHGVELHCAIGLHDGSNKWRLVTNVELPFDPIDLACNGRGRRHNATAAEAASVLYLLAGTRSTCVCVYYIYLLGGSMPQTQQASPFDTLA
jgi:hypothetical protein